MPLAIKVESLSKQYRLGQIGTGSIAHHVNRWWHTVRGKEDPYLKIGEANDRTKAGNSEYVWSLKDINFEIQQGDAVGIIGRNGAGKSTLLKILSRVTAPTTGTVKTRGRIASLLEVGTGFHPELSGRENIFLNGAILGMRKAEIKKRFDEIVEFAGVEKYIDTPVKRYSSGMYVRLAFGVAAHLESEILIVDEVLAVGDAEFQKKAFGKIKDVSNNEGRTVLFVSHNIAALKKICKKAILIEKGKIVKEGSINETINCYRQEQSDHSVNEIYFKMTDKRVVVESISVNGITENFIQLGSDAALNITITGKIVETLPINLQGNLYDGEDYPLAFFSPGHSAGFTEKFPKGDFVLTYTLNLPKNMNNGVYKLNIGLSDPGNHYYGEINKPIIISFHGITTETGLVFNSKKTGWLLLNA